MKRILVLSLAMLFLATAVSAGGALVVGQSAARPADEAHDKGDDDHYHQQPDEHRHACPLHAQAPPSAADSGLGREWICVRGTFDQYDGTAADIVVALGLVVYPGSLLPSREDPRREAHPKEHT